MENKPLNKELIDVLNKFKHNSRLNKIYVEYESQRGDAFVWHAVELLMLTPEALKVSYPKGDKYRGGNLNMIIYGKHTTGKTTAIHNILSKYIDFEAESEGYHDYFRNNDITITDFCDSELIDISCTKEVQNEMRNGESIPKLLVLPKSPYYYFKQLGQLANYNLIVPTTGVPFTWDQRVHKEETKVTKNDFNLLRKHVKSLSPGQIHIDYKIFDKFLSLPIELGWDYLHTAASLSCAQAAFDGSFNEKGELVVTEESIEKVCNFVSTLFRRRYNEEKEMLIKLKNK